MPPLTEVALAASALAELRHGHRNAGVEKRLRHPGHADLDRHVAQAVAKKTGRGWRLDKAGRDAQIDAAVSLAMALETAEHQPAPVELLGWL